MEDYNNIIKDEESTCYYLNGELHRLGGPAIEYANGDKEWYQHDKLHRIGGPAAERADGTKEWWENDLAHRMYGPAIEYADGFKEWWFKGERINCNSQEEFEKIIITKYPDIIFFELK
jgi:hypothetical protein